MTDLPPALAAFAQLLDAQPEPVRGAFNYCLGRLRYCESGQWPKMLKRVVTIADLAATSGITQSQVQ